ncbi:MAG: ribonuclease HII [Desulfobacterota bacterium]|nr:ribonuclease HII [Thermodesulfobacteriota bacterium]MDW8001836.1 ribonuclease HII [Deltaproteobacteria bacterium]
MECRLEGLISGVDEAGRGPVAGPLVSACVVWSCIPKKNETIKDSKLMKEKEREEAFFWILRNAYRVGIGISSIEEIEMLNIQNATLLAMERAIENTGVQADLLLIDGNKKPARFKNGKCVIGGDRKCFFIACASIVAKVVRDSIMKLYNELYPLYGFKKNKGYLTPTHKRAIELYGVCPIHRKKFRGVREYI